jgi:hypothetical protein
MEQRVNQQIPIKSVRRKKIIKKAVRKNKFIILLETILDNEIEDFVNIMLSRRNTPNSSNPFVLLVKRNISIDLFFNSLLCDEDLSRLLCTCQDMRELIRAWKQRIPMEQFKIKQSMTDKMLMKFLSFYSSNIENLVAVKYDEMCNFLSAHGFQKHFLPCLTRGSLKKLQISPYFLQNGGLKEITYSFTNLTHLTLIFGEQCKYLKRCIEINPIEAHRYYLPDLPIEDLNLISKLTNLEYLEFYCVDLLQDTTVINYSALTKIKSIRVSHSGWGLSGLGLSYLVANKDHLSELKIIHCCVSSEGYHCLTTLNSLTKLQINSIFLDDFGLKMICCSCVQIEYLDIKREANSVYLNPATITLEGYAHIHNLINLKTLFLYDQLSDVRLCNNTTLTSIHLQHCTISSDNGLVYNISSLVNLTTLCFVGLATITKERLSLLFHSLNNLSWLQIEAYCMMDSVTIIQNMLLKNNDFQCSYSYTHYCSTTHISALVNLKRLVLNDKVSDETLSHLYSCSNLKILNINNYQNPQYYDDNIILSDEGLSFLCSSLVNLTKVTLCDQRPCQPNLCEHYVLNN